MLLNNQGGHWRNKRRNEKIPGNKQKYNIPKSMGFSSSGPKREVYSNIGLPQETRKISNKQTLYLKGLEKEEQMKPNVSSRKKLIKIQLEISEIETKKQQKKINETKSWFFEKIHKIDYSLARLTKK